MCLPVHVSNHRRIPLFHCPPFPTPHLWQVIMSISTGDFCFRSCCASGMSGLNPTPCSVRSINIVTHHEEILKPVTEESWKREIEHRINVSKLSGNDFLTTFVPSHLPYPLPHTLNDPLVELFAGWEPVEGHEKESYPILVRG